MQLQGHISGMLSFAAPSLVITIAASDVRAELFPAVLFNPVVNVLFVSSVARRLPINSVMEVTEDFATKSSKS